MCSWKKLNRLFCWLCLITVWLSGCAPALQAQPATTLTVLAAASLVDPFTEIGARFEQEHPGVRVVFIFAGSQQLAQQLIQGAPGDVFASANQRYMDALLEAERISPDQVAQLGRNQLVVVYPASNPGEITALADLARPGLKLILAAKEVPVGQYSLEFLAKAAQDPSFTPTFQQEVLANVVSYESNVKAVVTKIALGEADAGIVYASDLSGTAAQDLDKLAIPPDLNVLAGYPIAPLQASPQPELAQDFIALVRSEAGQETLARYGFLPPE